jgi:hypothetical protein
MRKIRNLWGVHEMAVTDELQGAIMSLTWNAQNAAPILAADLVTLADVASQLSAGPPLDELNAVIGNLNWSMLHNAIAGQGLLAQLNDVLAQLLYGTETTNPADAAAIAQLTTAIYAKDPTFNDLLWVNYLPTTLTVSAIGFGTITMDMSALAPAWWTNWGSYDEAAATILGQFYMMQMLNTPTVSSVSNEPHSSEFWP